MGDERKNPGAAARIEVRSDDDLRYWAKLLGIEVKHLTLAVKTVGPSVAAIKQYLHEHPPQRDN